MTMSACPVASGSTQRGPGGRSRRGSPAAMGPGVVREDRALGNHRDAVARHELHRGADAGEAGEPTRRNRGTTARPDHQSAGPTLVLRLVEDRRRRRSPRVRTGWRPRSRSLETAATIHFGERPPRRGRRDTGRRRRLRDRAARRVEPPGPFDQHRIVGDDLGGGGRPAEGRVVGIHPDGGPSSRLEPADPSEQRRAVLAAIGHGHGRGGRARVVEQVERVEGTVGTAVREVPPPGGRCHAGHADRLHRHRRDVPVGRPRHALDDVRDARFDDGGDDTIGDVTGGVQRTRDGTGRTFPSAAVVTDQGDPAHVGIAGRGLGQRAQREALVQARATIAGRGFGEVGGLHAPRAGAAPVFIQVGHAVPVGIVGGAALAVVRAQRVLGLPQVGHAVRIGVGRGPDVEPQRGSSRSATPFGDRDRDLHRPDEVVIERELPARAKAAMRGRAWHAAAVVGTEREVRGRHLPHEAVLAHPQRIERDLQVRVDALDRHEDGERLARAKELFAEGPNHDRGTSVGVTGHAE